MKILYDLLGAQSEEYYNRGIGRYTLSLAQAMQKELAASADELEFLAHAAFPERLPGLRRALGVDRLRLFHAPEGMDIYGTGLRRTGELMAESYYGAAEADVLYENSLFEGFAGRGVLPRTFRGCGKYVVGLMHDLIPLIFSDHYLQDPQMRAWYNACLERVRSCDLLLANSESTRQDTIRYLGLEPERVVNIGAGVADIFEKKAVPNAQALLQHYGLRPGFVLYTGGLDWRKNIEGLIAGWGCVDPDLRRESQLVVVCKAGEAEQARLYGLAAQAGLSRDELAMTGFVPDEDLVSLYNLAELLVFPSLYEGFGLPIVEAMRCGTPVVGADNSSIREIIGNPSALFRAEDAQELAAVVTRVLADGGFRAELTAWCEERGQLYTWERSARLAIEAIRAGLAGKLAGSDHGQAAARLHPVPAQAGGRKKRLAWISPVPPVRSGIAAYTAELLPHLSERYEIDVFTDILPPADEPFRGAYPIYSWRELPARREGYALLVYNMGNSERHTYMHYLLMRYPGLVVQHDFYLGGMLNYYAAHEPSHRHMLEEELFYSHGWQGLEQLARDGSWQAEQDWPCNKRVLDVALGIVFHSPYCLELCRRFYGEAYAGQLRAAVVPMIIQREKDLAERTRQGLSQAGLRARYGYGSQDFIVACFGFLAPSKLDELLLRAVAVLEQRGEAAGLQLVFAGAVLKGEYGEQLDREIAALADRRRVRITGYLDDAEYLDYLVMADLAVQLRQNSRGETSGTVPECIMMGVPVLLNRYATFADYPPGVVSHVSPQPTPEELAEAISRLRLDDASRREQAGRAMAYLSETHGAARVAALYAEQIERAISRSAVEDKEKFIRTAGAALAGTGGGAEAYKQLARCYEANLRSVRPHAHPGRLYACLDAATRHILPKEQDGIAWREAVTCHWDNVSGTFCLNLPEGADTCISYELPWREGDVLLAEAALLTPEMAAAAGRALAALYAVGTQEETESLPEDVRCWLTGSLARESLPECWLRFRRGQDLREDQR